MKLPILQCTGVLAIKVPRSKLTRYLWNLLCLVFIQCKHWSIKPVLAPCLRRQARLGNEKADFHVSLCVANKKGPAKAESRKLQDEGLQAKIDHEIIPFHPKIGVESFSFPEIDQQQNEWCECKKRHVFTHMSFLPNGFITFSTLPNVRYRENIAHFKKAGIVPIP